MSSSGVHLDDVWCFLPYRVQGDEGPGDRLDIRLVAVPLALVGLLLSLVSLVLPRVATSEVLTDASSPLVRFIDTRAEANLPTWFNVALLAVAAAAHLFLAGLSRAMHERAWPWLLTALLLALLSLDDLASVHERLGPAGSALGGGDGALHFAWLVLGLPIALAVVLAASAASRRLPRQSRTLFLAGILVLLLSAVGFELAGGAILDGIGDGPAYILVSPLEELIETLAAVVLLCSAVVGVSVRPHSSQRGVVLSVRS